MGGDSAATDELGIMDLVSVVIALAAFALLLALIEGLDRV